MIAAIACALASIWVGAWLTGSVFKYEDWQHMPAWITSALLFFASSTFAFKLFVDWVTE